jgi:type VI secretion system Hcp family effector
LVLLGCAVSALLPVVNAVAAMDAYITAVGTKQGQIKGDSASGSHVSAVVHETATATGVASGKRQHSVITITKEVDAASPKFATAMATNEVLSQVVITFGGTGAGAGKVAQKIELADATVSGIRKVGNSEQITFSYDKIVVTYAKGGKSAMDDWSAPN